MTLKIIPTIAIALMPFVSTPKIMAQNVKDRVSTTLQMSGWNIGYLNNSVQLQNGRLSIIFMSNDVSSEDLQKAITALGGILKNSTVSTYGMPLLKTGDGQRLTLDKKPLTEATLNVFKTENGWAVSFCHTFSSNLMNEIRLTNRYAFYDDFIFFDKNFNLLPKQFNTSGTKYMGGMESPYIFAYNKQGGFDIRLADDEGKIIESLKEITTLSIDPATRSKYPGNFSINRNALKKELRLDNKEYQTPISPYNNYKVPVSYNGTPLFYVTLSPAGTVLMSNGSHPDLYINIFGNPKKDVTISLKPQITSITDLKQQMDRVYLSKEANGGVIDTKESENIKNIILYEVNKTLENNNLPTVSFKSGLSIYDILSKEKSFNSEYEYYINTTNLVGDISGRKTNHSKSSLKNGVRKDSFNIDIFNVENSIIKK